MLGDYSNQVVLLPPIADTLSGLLVRDPGFKSRLEVLLNKLYFNGINHLVLVKGAGDYSLINDLGIIENFVISKYDLDKYITPEIKPDKSSYLSDTILDLVPTIPTPSISLKDEDMNYRKVLRYLIKNSKIRILCTSSYDDLHNTSSFRTQTGGAVTFIVSEVEVASYINGGKIRMDYLIP